MTTKDWQWLMNVRLYLDYFDENECKSNKGAE